jgi:hypothetical protein
MLDPRLAFVTLAVHCLSVSGNCLDEQELKGLKMILESIVIEYEEGSHDRL